MNSGFDSGSEKKKVSALDATFELVKRIQEDVRASQALLRSRESNKEDMEELIWLLKEDNNHLKVMFVYGCIEIQRRLQMITDLLIMCV